MSVDDSYYTVPDDSGVSFTKEEWARAKKAEEAIKKRLAKRCKHLVKGGAPTTKPKVDWDRIKAERARLEQKERDAKIEANGFEPLPYSEHNE